jgi:hypothetical protein
MNHFHAAFLDEVSSTLFTPMAKSASPGRVARAMAKTAEGDAAGSHSLKKRIDALGVGKFKRPLARLAGSTAGIAAFHKMVDPDVGLGSALGGGLALTGGGMAGEQVAQNLKLGPRGKAGLSILGSVLALRALRNRAKRKAQEEADSRRRARARILSEHASKEGSR